jgi:glutaredoxin 2
MAAGFLKLPFESIVLPYNDEATPQRLMNKKMLPIFEFGEGSISNESLIIIERLDKKDLLQNNESSDTELDALLSKIGSDLHSLCMPYWIYSPEFNDESRDYFQKKKEMKRGPFKELIQRKEVFLKGLTSTLEEVESRLTPFYKSESLGIRDIMLASHLWGMYIFPEFQFSQKVHNYLQTVKKQTHFDYHKDFWS